MFYCGLIDEGQFSFAYDCGTETSGVSLKTYMNFLYRWNRGKQLDFIAISHFHKDHISGIKDLERLIGFKKIYFPYICDNELVREFLIRVSFFGISEIENSTDKSNIIFTNWKCGRFIGLVLDNLSYIHFYSNNLIVF